MRAKFNVFALRAEGLIALLLICTALCFKATIDDPIRFQRSRSIGPISD
jgi:hypothetical protein